jgi:hypothetical protein
VAEKLDWKGLNLYAFMHWLFLNILWFARSFFYLKLICQNCTEKQKWEGEDCILHVCNNHIVLVNGTWCFRRNLLAPYAVLICTVMRTCCLIQCVIFISHVPLVAGL